MRRWRFVRHAGGGVVLLLSDPEEGLVEAWPDPLPRRGLSLPELVDLRDAAVAEIARVTGRRA